MHDKIDESAEFEKWRGEQIASLQRMGYPDAAKAFRNHGSLHWAGWQARAALAATPTTAAAQEPVEVYLALAEEEYEAPIVLRAFANKAEAEVFAQALSDYQRTRPEWPVGDAELDEVLERDKETRAWMAAHPGGEDAAWRRFFSVIAVPFSVAPTCAAQDGDAQLDAMRRSGLSIDGDNAYKRDLIDCIVGALMLGKQGVNPPPKGHWAEQFWQMARGEGEIQEQLAAAPAAPVAVQPLPYWAPCNPACDPELNGSRSKLCDCAQATAALAAPPAAQQPDTVKAPRELLDSAARSCANGWVDYHTARELRALLGKEGEA
jgi:hypothetical protein